jgi:hypothetical protein
VVRCVSARSSSEDQNQASTDGRFSLLQLFSDGEQFLLALRAGLREAHFKVVEGALASGGNEAIVQFHGGHGASSDQERVGCV